MLYPCLDLVQLESYLTMYSTVCRFLGARDFLARPRGDENISIISHPLHTHRHARPDFLAILARDTVERLLYTMCYDSNPDNDNLELLEVAVT